jgi:hypothetical protein
MLRTIKSKGIPKSLAKSIGLGCLFVFSTLMFISISTKNGYLVAILGWFTFISLRAYSYARYARNDGLQWEEIKRIPMPGLHHSSLRLG